MQSDSVTPKFKPIHPVWMRITHWLNALAVLMLVTSGWRIYNAAPFFPLEIPGAITLGGWLGGALQWHFAAMWLLAANGLVYLSLNIVSRRLFRKFFPLSVGGIVRDGLAALHGKLSHADPRHYNSVQRFAYLFVMLDITVLVLSGLVLWKSVQFAVLRDLLGGYDFARRIHFVAMALLVGFVAVHLVMVALVPKTLLTMLSGRAGAGGDAGNSAAKTTSEAANNGEAA
jgi:thiosulfate reductase cytochrome b subunit